jgi:hypothetical protein
MGEGDEVCWTSRMGIGGKCSVGCWFWEVESPESVGGEETGALDDDLVVEMDVDFGGGESGCAACITKLPDGDKIRVSEGWKERCGAGGWRQVWKVEVNDVC